MWKRAKIYVAGGNTMIGCALLYELERQGYHDVCGWPGDEPDLARFDQVETFFGQYRPDFVFLAAGKSGGIAANQRYPADLMLDNLHVTCNLLEAAHRHGATKLLYLASSCSYPRDCPQPMREEMLGSGPLEPTSAPYATAKLAALALCAAYRQQYGNQFVAGIPADVFGLEDDFSPDKSHVVAGLIRRMHEAKAAERGEVVVWGTGSPRREFLFADELARACIFVMERYDETEPINLGGGAVLSIRALAELIQEVVGFDGALVFDASRPDGMPFKALDSSKLAALGWQARTNLREALQLTYWDFLKRFGSRSEAQKKQRGQRSAAD